MEADEPTGAAPGYDAPATPPGTLLVRLMTGALGSHCHLYDHDGASLDDWWDLGVPVPVYAMIMGDEVQLNSFPATRAFPRTFEAIHWEVHGSTCEPRCVLLSTRKMLKSAAAHLPADVPIGYAFDPAANVVHVRVPFGKRRTVRVIWGGMGEHWSWTDEMGRVLFPAQRPHLLDQPNV